MSVKVLLFIHLYFLVSAVSVVISPFFIAILFVPFIFFLVHSHQKSVLLAFSVNQLLAWQSI